MRPNYQLYEELCSLLCGRVYETFFGMHHPGKSIANDDTPRPSPQCAGCEAAEEVHGDYFPRAIRDDRLYLCFLLPQIGSYPLIHIAGDDDSLYILPQRALTPCSFYLFPGFLYSQVPAKGWLVCLQDDLASNSMMVGYEHPFLGIQQ